MKIKAAVKKSFEKVEKIPERQSGFLGRADGVVRVTGKKHWVYVRLWDGSVIEAYNQNVPANFGLAVNVLYQGGRYLVQARQVYNEMVDTSIPDGIEEELQWPNQRALYLRPEQFLAGLVYPKSGMVVYLFGGTVRLPGGGFARIPPQEIDLEPYRPASGATWAVIALESSGAASVTTGGDAASWQALALADIPTTTGFPVAGVRLFAGQTSIQHGEFGSMIQDLRWFQQGGGGSVSLPADKVIATDGDGLVSDNSPDWVNDDMRIEIGDEPIAGLDLSGDSGVHVGASDGKAASNILTTISNVTASILSFIRAMGTKAAPTPPITNSSLGGVLFGGLLPDGGGIQTGAARVIGRATEDWTVDNRGAKVQLYATPNQSTTPQVVAEFGGNEITLYKSGYGITPDAEADGTELATTEWVRDNVTNTVLGNVRYLLPFSSYSTLGSPISASPAYPYAATLPGFAIYPKRWSQGVFIGAVNNASNYWMIELVASVSGSDTIIATLNTSALGTSAAAVLTTTTFSPTLLTQASNIRLAVKATKVGSPSNLSAHGPALEYTLA